LESASGPDELSQFSVAFEVAYSDLAARIGRLQTRHGVIETPAFVPVIHPVRQTISPKFLKSLGFSAIITNAYIALEHYGDIAREKGIHEIVDFDGVVMTDSGGYQVLEYGSIGVEPGLIAQFEKDIGSDICVPLDKPTGYGLDYPTAKSYVEQTLSNAKDTLPIILEGSTDVKKLHQTKKEARIYKQIWAGPIQGAEHLDLVRHAASELDKIGYTLMALGSPVEIMEAYEFSILAQMIASVKSAVPTKPIHLFGAGHPLTIPLVVALGCDMFDSASYMLYAKDNRYMHSNGTARLEDLIYLPCHCPVCTKYSAKELLNIEKETRTAEIAKHNLYILQSELNTVKQAIVDGRLWEYVIQKSRAHPKLMDAVEMLKNTEFLGQGTPLFKQKAIFLFDPIDQFRPEAVYFRQMVSRFRSRIKDSPVRTLILYPEHRMHPFYTTQDYKQLTKKFPNAQLCTYNRFLGIIPAEISDIFPAAHNLTAKLTTYQSNGYPSFVESLKGFLRNNEFDEVTIIADQFIKNMITNDRSILGKISAKVIDYDKNVTSVI
jgi:7-cyano-7-deazaguanine tRNA-ribosyltransferase